MSQPSRSRIQTALSVPLLTEGSVAGLSYKKRLKKGIDGPMLTDAAASCWIGLNLNKIFASFLRLITIA